MKKIDVRRFRVAVSFPGEFRGLVNDVVDGLLKYFNKDEIFYDYFYRSELAMPNLDLYLQNVYNSESDVIVVFMCQEYNDKEWCGIEWRAIRSLMNSKETVERILFVKCGDGKVSGVFHNIDGYIDSNQVATEEIVSDIVKRYCKVKNISIDELIDESKCNGNTKESNIEKIVTQSLAIKEKKNIWSYNIVLLDDNQEQLELLENAINGLKCKYRINVYPMSKATDVILKNEDILVDIFVLDVVRSISDIYRTCKADYFGYDLYKQLLIEKGDTLRQTRIYVYTKLPYEIVREEFGDAGIEYLSKVEYSVGHVADVIKKYLDTLFENSQNVNE